MFTNNNQSNKSEVEHYIKNTTKNFYSAIEEIISSLDPNIKTYIMGDFNINLLDYSSSPPVEKFSI